MKRGIKKSLTLGTFSIFLTTLAMSIVSAITPEEFFESTKTFLGSAFMTIFGLEAGTGVIELAVIKALFALLLFLIIYSVSDALPFLENKRKMAILISAIITYLSVMYITPNDFYTILVSYTTMAIVITSAIPLAVILALTYKLANNPSAGKIILQKVIMGTYALVLAYKLLELWGAFGLSTGVDAAKISKLAYPLYGGTLLIIIILIIAFDTIRGFMLRQATGSLIDISAVTSRKKATAAAISLRQQATTWAAAGDADGARLLRAQARAFDAHARSVEGAV